MSSNPFEWDEDYRRGYSTGYKQARIDMAPRIVELMKLREVAKAAQDYVTKMARIFDSDEYQSTWAMGWIHAGQYTGETSYEEQEALVVALAALEEESSNG